jgi:hypothetical protein
MAEQSAILPLAFNPVGGEKMNSTKLNPIQTIDGIDYVLVYLNGVNNSEYAIPMRVVKRAFAMLDGETPVHIFKVTNDSGFIYYVKYDDNCEHSCKSYFIQVNKPDFFENGRVALCRVWANNWAGRVNICKYSRGEHFLKILQNQNI